jgi:hypothetical protein
MTKSSKLSLRIPKDLNLGKFNKQEILRPADTPNNKTSSSKTNRKPQWGNILIRNQAQTDELNPPETLRKRGFVV